MVEIASRSLRATAVIGLMFMLAGCQSLPPPSTDLDLPASAAARFDAKRILWSETHGPRHIGGPPVELEDPARIASISKLVVALGAMRLVEAGKLDLDRDVSDYLGWRLRNPAFPDRAISLRLLLSHQSSVTDGIEYYALPLGTSLKDAVANPKAWDATHPPGAWFDYSNLNFGLIGSVMEAATGERFDRLIKRQVLDPLAIDACFNWQGCSPGAVARAITLYRPNGDVARDAPGTPTTACPVVPAVDGSCDLARWRAGENGAMFSPQGGLRISVAGLTKIGQMLLADGGGFLSPDTIAEMTRAQWRYDGSNGATSNGFYCAYGLAIQITAQPMAGCRDDPVGDGRVRFGHGGDAYSLKSGLWIDPSAKTGIAYLTTRVAEDAGPGSRSAYTVPEEAIAARAIKAR